MMNSRWINLFSISLLFVLTLSCDPEVTDNENELSPPSASLFREWSFSKVQRGCVVNTQSFNRVCSGGCNVLKLTDGTQYSLSNESNNFEQTGTFTLLANDEIIFDPPIFFTEGVGKARMVVLSNVLEFFYRDEVLDCDLSETYIEFVEGGEGG